MPYSARSERKQAFRHYARLEVALAVWVKPLAMGMWRQFEGKLTKLSLNGGLLLCKQSWQLEQCMQLELELPNLARRLVGKGKVVSLQANVIAPPWTAVGIRLLEFSVADYKQLADFLDMQSKAHE